MKGMLCSGGVCKGGFEGLTLTSADLFPELEVGVILGISPGFLRPSMSPKLELADLARVTSESQGSSC